MDATAFSPPRSPHATGGESCPRMLTERWILGPATNDLEATLFQLDSHPFLNFSNARPCSTRAHQTPHPTKEEGSLPMSHTELETGRCQRICYLSPQRVWTRHRESSRSMASVLSQESLVSGQCGIFGQADKASLSLAGKSLCSRDRNGNGASSSFQ